MYQFSTLSEIATNIIQQQNIPLISSAIGCIIDIQRPIYRQKQNSFIMEIKIIDQSFNQNAENSFLIKYLSLFLISNKRQDLEFSYQIGGFIYLQKFMFYLWNDIKLSAKYHGTYQSVFQIQSGSLEDQDFQIVKKLGRENQIIDFSLLSLRVSEMKIWLNEHFLNIFNPFLGVKIINNFCSLIQPFSMILKVDDQLQNQFQRHLYLTDSGQNTFYADLKEFRILKFKKSQWVLLRGIKKIDTNFQIIFSQSGNILKLPQLFSQQYIKKSNYQAIYRKTSKIGGQKKEDAKLTYITVSDQKPSTVKELFQLKDKYLGTSKKQQVLLQNNFLVKGAVVKYHGKIKLYHTQYQMMVHDKFLEGIPTQQKRETIDQKKLTYLYEGTLYVMDRSITSKRQILKIKLFTNDSKSMFFQQKGLQYLNDYIGNSDQKQKVLEAQRKVNQKLQKLLQLSSFQNPASFVLQPIKSDELIFRLINTKII